MRLALRYRIYRWLETRKQHSIEKKLSPELVQAFAAHKIDLYEYRFYSKQVSIAMVDAAIQSILPEVPQRTESGDSLRAWHREQVLMARARMGMVLKNQLMDEGLMEGGYLISKPYQPSILRSLVRLVQRYHRRLVIYIDGFGAHEKSWSYPYSEVDRESGQMEKLVDPAEASREYLDRR